MKYLYGSVIWVMGSLVYAYEPTTHEDIVNRAYDQSVLASGEEFWAALGVDEDENFLFLPTTQFTRDSLDVGRSIRTPLTIMRSGAAFEDSLAGLRPLNHFYDPSKNRALTVAGVALGETSPDWILEDRHNIPKQLYSYKNARDYFYRAITSRDEFGREILYGKLFRSLGQILHHLGDMAQPQHVRNNAHLPAPIFGDPSLREIYTAGVMEGEFNDQDAIDNHLRTQLLAQLNGYAPVAFTRPRDYWDGEGANEGKGLAEFTNREFLSKDTNFNMPDAQDYAAPAQEQATPFTIDDVSSVFTAYGMTVPALCQDPEKPCAMKFYSMRITDNLRPASSGQNAFATTESVYNEDIDNYNRTNKGRRPVITKRFTLNKLNLWSGYPFLLSRAVGYSSGLLNFFFRGRLEASKVDYNGNEVSFFLKNAIDFETVAEWSEENLTAGGQLVVAYKYRSVDGSERRGISNTVTLPEDISPGETGLKRLRFTYSALPEGAILIEQSVIYKGVIGEEGRDTNDAVAFGSFRAESALFALVRDGKSPIFPYSDTLNTSSVFKSMDGGRNWQRVWGPTPHRNHRQQFRGNIASEGVGKIRVAYAVGGPLSTSPYLTEIISQVCSDDVGVTWYDCTVVNGIHQREYNEQGVFNAGKGWLSAYRDHLGGGYHVDRLFHSTAENPDWHEVFSSANARMPLFRLVSKDEVSVLFVADSQPWCYPADLLVCHNSKVASDYRSFDGGATWTLFRDRVPYEEQNFYTFWYNHEHILDINRMVIPKIVYRDEYYLDASFLSFLNFKKLAFTDDNGMSEFGEIDVSQFTTNFNSSFEESAYLGDGRMVLKLSEYYSVDGTRQGVGEKGDRLLLSTDYGETWEQVNSLNARSSTGTLDSFGNSSSRSDSGIIGIEAVPLTEENLYIIK